MRALVTAAVVVLVVSMVPRIVVWVPVFTALIVTAVSCLLAYKLEIARFYVLAVLALALGLAASLSGLDQVVAIAAFWGALGAVQTLLGVWTFASFLRRTGPNDEQLS